MEYNLFNSEIITCKICGEDKLYELFAKNHIIVNYVLIKKQL